MSNPSDQIIELKLPASIVNMIVTHMAQKGLWAEVNQAIVMIGEQANAQAMKPSADMACSAGENEES